MQILDAVNSKPCRDVNGNRVVSFCVFTQKLRTPTNRTNYILVSRSLGRSSHQQAETAAAAAAVVAAAATTTPPVMPSYQLP
jgi:hypothetical protein